MLRLQLLLSRSLLCKDYNYCSVGVYYAKITITTKQDFIMLRLQLPLSSSLLY